MARIQACSSVSVSLECLDLAMMSLSREIYRMALDKKSGHIRNESSIESCVILFSSKRMDWDMELGQLNNDPRVSTLFRNKISLVSSFTRSCVRTDESAESGSHEGFAKFGMAID